MKQRQSSKLSMLLALNDYLSINESIVQTIPNLLSITQSIKSVVKDIQSASQVQMLNRNGVSGGKKQVKAQLVGVGADIARKLAAYAIMNGDEVLLREVKTSDYKLSRLSDMGIISRSMLLLDLGSQHLTAVAAYGLKQEDLTSLDRLIKDYNAVIPDPRLAIVEKKQATERLAELFRTVDELLVKADLLVGIVKLSQPLFYAGYKLSRVIVDRNGRGLQIKILVIDQLDKQPIKNVTCTLMPVKPNGKGKPILKKTAGKGIAYVKSLDEGEYIITAGKVGYKEHSGTIYVTKKEFEKVVIEMEK